MTAATFKRCPFCASTKVFVVRAATPGPFHASCSDCGARGPGVYCESRTSDPATAYAQQSATDKWNVRNHVNNRKGWGVRR